METIRCKNSLGGYSEVPKEKFFFRPSVYGVILENDKIILLTNKSNGKYWFPGGGINVGEKTEDALRREINEETGLSVEIIRPLLYKESFFYYEPEDGAYHAFLMFYLCRALPGTKLIEDELVDDLESVNPRWIPIRKLKPSDFSDLEEDLFAIVQSLTKDKK
ncbi:MAG: NUDIX domain-containing protein [Patescibacteria group bacterium]|jgi:8-oxo-dGTP diphosphatase